MAKKKRTVRRKSGGKVTRYLRGAGGGGYQPIIQGAMAGIAEQLGARFLGASYGDEIGLAGAWYLTKNPTLGTILGLRLAQFVPLGAVGLGPTGTGNTVGGYA